MPSAYLNGEWLAVADAKVSVLDRGFLFGDGVYEVIPVYEGKLFCLDRHISRFLNSLAEVYMDSPLDAAGWASLLQTAVEKSVDDTAALYLQMTRGADAARSFVYPAVPKPTIFIMVNPAPNLKRGNVTPLKLVTLEDFRWDRGHIKTTSLIAAGILKNQAIAAGADDAALFKDGKVTEASSANLFAVQNGVVVTPPKSTRLLHGITRDFLIELAQQNDIAVEEREITVEELKQADEVFITSSTMEAWPVGRIDDKPVGNGAPGVIWQKLDALFQQHKVM